MNGLITILLNIPQGVVTFGSAVMAGLVMLIGAAVGFALSIHGRVRALETKLEPIDAHQLATTNARMEILWEQYRYESMPRLRRTVSPPENPMLQERWDELIKKLEKKQLPDDEAEELLAAFLKRRDQALEEDDMETIMLLGHGIVLTKWQLKQKELREQK